MEGGPDAVDPVITGFLDGVWDNWVAGAREAYAG